MLKKFRKKLKKGLKKAAPAIGLLGAAALAARGMGRRKQNKLYEYEEGGDLSRPSLPISKRQVEGLNFPAGTNLSGMSKIAARGTIDEKDYDIYGNRIMAKGGRVGHKKGGRVGVGVAKRGFGRAMKGRK